MTSELLYEKKKKTKTLIFNKIFVDFKCYKTVKNLKHRKPFWNPNLSKFNSFKTASKFKFYKTDSKFKSYKTAKNSNFMKPLLNSN